jgi:hypothetical protein
VKALFDAALVGVGRAGVPDADPDDAGERIAARANETAPERALLLRLGVQAVRARAGYVAATGAARPEPAPAETRPPCSAALAAVVADLAEARNKVVLAEALERMDARRLRLPPERLPALAALRDATLLPAAAGVAGARGRWLAAHNPAWSWLTGGVAPASLDERRRTWEEGATEARLAALRATRADEPAQARAWVEAAWKAEKAALREQVLDAFAIGLSGDDEAFLTQALADRAAGVRASAARLLARIESSPLATRARERADVLLAYAPPTGGVLASLKSKLGGKAHGVLTATPPQAFDAAWAEDGLVEKAPQGLGARAHWLIQLLALVPPAHWERRFGAAPEALVGAAAKDEWANAVLGGWIEAARRFDARAWAAPLWAARADKIEAGARADLAAALLPLMDGAAVDAAAADFIEGEPPRWLSLLALVPRPWGPSVSHAFGKALRAFMSRSTPFSWPDVRAVESCLELAGPALPVAALDDLCTLDPPVTDGTTGSLVRAFDSFRSVAAVRKRIAEETRP